MRLNNWPSSESRASRDRKTIREWEQEFGIFILDLDGFDKTDPKLYDRLFSQSEFEQAAAECTILQRNPNERPEPFRNTVETASAREGSDALGGLAAVIPSIKDMFGAATNVGAKHPKRQRQRTRERERTEEKNLAAGTRPAELAAQPSTKSPAPSRLSKLNRRPLVLMLFLTTLPTLITVGLNWLYRQLQSRWNIPWYVPAAILGLDAFIVWIQPVSPMISGPLYLWYVLFNEVSLILHGLITFIKVNLLHQPPGLTAAAPVPFLSSFSLAGNAVPLYFSLGKALTSSMFIATVITFVRDVVQRMFTFKKP